MTRKPSNGPRVTQRKKAVPKQQPDAPKIEPKKRTPKQKTEEYRELVQDQTDVAPVDSSDVDDLLAFEYNGQEFRFKPVDQDMAGMLASMSMLGDGTITDNRDMLKLILVDGDWERLRRAMKTDIAQVNANRQKWKDEGSNPNDEPIGVIDYMNQVVIGVTGLYTKAVEANPKGVE